jgi:aminomethyltransferase
MAEQKTALFEQHKLAGAKMVPFGGWKMPVSYAGVLKEHESVRTGCGVFDVSHMGEIFVSGKEAEKFLQLMTINDITRLSQGKGQYTAILNEKGGMIDDLIVYCIGEDRYLICANASNCQKDYEWIKQHASDFEVTVENQSDAFNQLAIQGPASTKALISVLPEHKDVISGLDYMGISTIQLSGQTAYLARTGYTGESGFEVYLPESGAIELWKKLLASDMVQPIGLGARDTLRLEACYLLYGNDMNETVSPLEAGIGWATKLDFDFIGRDALLVQKEQGVKRKLVAFKMLDGGIPRHDMAVFSGDENIGTVTSGSVLPTVGGAGGLALLNSDFANIGNKVEIDVRGKRKLAEVVKKPLYIARVKA